jgi:hypothetical protein
MNFAAMPAHIRKTGAPNCRYGELDSAKIGVVLVVLAAIALKAQSLKIVDASRASLATRDNYGRREAACLLR